MAHARHFALCRYGCVKVYEWDKLLSISRALLLRPCSGVYHNSKFLRLKARHAHAEQSE